MNIKIPPKIHKFRESVIREMTRIAEEENAINLSQGLPDFSAPEELKRAAILAIENDFNQYSFTYGLKQLREKISEKVKQKNNIVADPYKEITVTCGVSEGIMASCLALLEKGDEVIVFEPYYENYLPGIILSGATPVFVPLQTDDFSLNLSHLKEKFNKHTKALILNTPMNPSGKLFSKEELDEIANLCERWNTIVITDEIYEDIIYDEKEHISYASLEGNFETTVSVMGFSKSYGVTGWRVGYVVAPEPISNAIRKVHDYLTICAPTPFQKAAITALSLSSSYYISLKSNYEKKRDLICDKLMDMGFKLNKPAGAYYVMVDFSDIAPDKNDIEFATFLAEKSGVATVPGSSFYSNETMGNNQIRFSYAVKDKTIKKAMERINLKLNLNSL